MAKKQKAQKKKAGQNQRAEHMDVLAVCGSHRKGNTEFALRKILDRFSEKGAKCEIVLLREKKIEFCGGGNCCEKSKSCHMTDDMGKIYAKIISADALVLGSPAYFSNVSALMKNFIDRMNPYWEDERLKGKKVIIVTVGGIESSALKCAENLKEFARICRMKVVETLVFTAENAGDLSRNGKAIKEIEKAAEGAF